jgi:hypothetical protein
VNVVDTQMIEHTINVGGLSVRYVTAGAGNSLVLLHGLGDSATDWRWVMPSLARNYRGLCARPPWNRLKRQTKRGLLAIVLYAFCRGLSGCASLAQRDTRWQLARRISRPAFRLGSTTTCPGTGSGRQRRTWQGDQSQLTIAEHADLR